MGNSYGAHLNDNPREVPTPEAAAAAGLAPFSETYPAAGDPNGLIPVVPTIAPLTDKSGNRLPYIASNDITAFTIFDTGRWHAQQLLLQHPSARFCGCKVR